MPTILDSYQSADQPKVVLAPNIQPNVQPTVSPPIQPVGNYYNATTTPKTAPAAASTDQLISQLNQAETKLSTELQSISSQQSSLLDKITSLLEQTGLMESKEAKLNKSIQALQQLRAAMQTQPDQAQALLDEADLPKEIKLAFSAPTLASASAVATAPTMPEPQPIPPATLTTPPINAQPTTVPVIKPMPTPAGTIEATTLTQDQVIARLQAQFGQMNPTLQTTLVAGAQVYTTPDKGILVESGGPAVQFSTDDLAAAGIAFEALRELPQKITALPIQPAMASTNTLNQPLSAPTPAQPTNSDQSIPASGIALNEQKLIEKLQTAHIPEAQPLLIAGARIFLSPDGNGVIVANGQLSQHLSDAQLIQLGATAADLQGLQPMPGQNPPA